MGLEKDLVDLRRICEKHPTRKWLVGALMDVIEKIRREKRL